MFQKRRDEFLSKMKDGIAIFRNSDESVRSNDTHYKYRPDTDFYYLTGLTEPNSVAVFLPQHPEHKFVLFVRPRDPERETWDGRRAGVEGAVKDFGADISFSIDELDEKLPEMMKNMDNLYYTLGTYEDFDSKIIKMVSNLRKRVRKGDSAPTSIIETSSITHSMRLVKKEEEIELMKKANFISQEGHIELMKTVKAGMYEYELEALVENIFRKNGANGVAYNSIVGTGINATILHYTENNTELKDGELLLVDAGAEYKYYCGDITRTIPVNGKFSKAQKEVYEVVLEAELEALKIAKPGVKFHDIHARAVEVITDGLVKLGFLKGSVEKLIEDEKYKTFYMHNTSHWLGMDVHDAGKYFVNGESIKLESGMILTIEPGLYIQEGVEGVPSEYIGIGIRIEDDVLITENGHEVLSQRVPKTVEDIEKMMSK
ncbi:MAG: aminopeptidase P N-terminal domain-containing protein [Cyanobacteriota bacterium]